MDRHMIMATASILLQKNQKILLLRRKNTKYMDGYRGLPGGKLEQGEGFLSCAIREVKEEIGIKLNIQEIKGPFWIYKSPNIIICFWKSVERIGKEKIGEPEKCSELKRFDIQELSQDILPDHKLAIDMINKGKNFLEIGF